MRMIVRPIGLGWVKGKLFVEILQLLPYRIISLSGERHL